MAIKFSIIARVNIEHAFGVLRERWKSLKVIPMRIWSEYDYSKAFCWMMHNFIQVCEEDGPWLESTMLRAGERRREAR
jgi:hypothetical protein